MTIFAPALIGIPPVGLGVYSRGHVGAAGPWRWFTGREWGFVGVEGMHADVWRAHADHALADAIDNGRSGVILDPETPYPASALIALGDWIRDASRRVRVGVTSFPSWAGIELLAERAPRRFWGSPQLYYDARTNAAGWARWRSVFGFRLVPSVAGYVSGPITAPAVAALRGTATGYAEHLASVPRAGGAIVWPNWPMPDYMLDALARRYSGPAALTLVPGATLAALDTIPGMVFLVLVLLAMFAAASVVGSRYA